MTRQHRFPEPPKYTSAESEPNPEIAFEQDQLRRRIYAKARGLLSPVDQLVLRAMAYRPLVDFEVRLDGPSSEWGLYRDNKRFYPTEPAVNPSEHSDLYQALVTAVNACGWDARLNCADKVLAFELEPFVADALRSQAERAVILRFLNNPTVRERAAQNGPHEAVTSAPIVLARLTEIAKHW